MMEKMKAVNEQKRAEKLSESTDKDADKKKWVNFKFLFLYKLLESSDSDADKKKWVNFKFLFLYKLLESTDFQRFIGICKTKTDKKKCVSTSA